jgi:alpha-L-rhamnosidase
MNGLSCRDESASCPAWTARWISVPGEKLENYYFLARQYFLLAKLPQTALLRVAADSRYAVYVNGRFVGNGPARGTHRRYFFDSYDVAGYLKAGENWIAAEVHCPVRPTFTMAPSAPALLAEIEGVVASNAAWQVRLDPSHRADAPLYTFQVGFSEWENLPAETVDWQTGKGAVGWQSAVEVGTPKDFGGRIVVPRPISGLTSHAIRPAAVADFGRVPGLWPGDMNAEYAARMAAEEHRPPEPAQFQHLSGLIGGDGVAIIQPCRDGDDACVIFDFGREVFGHLVADIEASGQTVMDVGYVEYLSEKRANITPSNTSYRFADRFVLREGWQVVTPRLHSRGCRYIQIVFRNLRTPVRIHSLRFLNRVYSCEPRASFTCSDPFLDRLWKMCVNTIRLCSSDTFMDCPSREQAFWLNDQAVTSLMYLAMTGDRVFAAHNLRVGADGALPNGLIPAVYPSAREAPVTHFPIMPALWTWSLSDYFAYTGDSATLKELLPQMTDALHLYDQWRDEDGLVPNQPGMWNFIDWGYGSAMLPPGKALPGKTAALNMAIAAAYQRAAFLERAVGEDRRAEAYAARSRDTVSALAKVLWDNEKGRYRDCTVPEGSGTASQHPLAIGLAFDLLDEPQRSRALANLLHPELIQAELYFQHYVLQSLMRHGRATDALRVVRQLWGPMVAAGSDTVWESKLGPKAWDGAGSLCHAFSCGPLHAMQAGILGVWPLQPGFREFAWRPQPGDLATAEGDVPTPLGNIRTGWRRMGRDKLKAEITVPQGARAVLASGEALEAGTHSLEVRLTSACP